MWMRRYQEQEMLTKKMQARLELLEKENDELEGTSSIIAEKSGSPSTMKKVDLLAFELEEGSIDPNELK